MKKCECRECKTGQQPEKQPDVTLEEIERLLTGMQSAEYAKHYNKWLSSRPLAVQKAAKEFPPSQMYRVKNSAPYKYTVGGSIVSPHSIVEHLDEVEVRFQVLRSPIGHAGISAVIDPKHLELVSLEKLRSDRGR